jgi:hypothetical protein
MTRAWLGSLRHRPEATTRSREFGIPQVDLKLWANASDTFLVCRNYAGALRDLPLAKFAIEIIPASARQASFASIGFPLPGKRRLSLDH